MEGSSTPDKRHALMAEMTMPTHSPEPPSPRKRVQPLFEITNTPSKTAATKVRKPVASVDEDEQLALDEPLQPFVEVGSRLAHTPVRAAAASGKAAIVPANHLVFEDPVCSIGASSSVTPLSVNTTLTAPHRNLSLKPKARNTVNKLFNREMGQRGNRFLANNHVNEKFRNYRKLHTYRMPSNWHDSYFASRSSYADTQVVEVIAVESLVFSLTLSGHCTCINRGTGKPVHTINDASREEVIRSMFYNRRDDSLITLCLHAPDKWSALHCRSIPLAQLRQGKFDISNPLFTSETLKWPGFVEFDDVNGCVLTFAASESTYKVWDLTDYSLLYTITDPGVQEIKMSPGFMLILHQEVQTSPEKIAALGVLRRAIRRRMGKKEGVSPRAELSWECEMKMQIAGVYDGAILQSITIPVGEMTAATDADDELRPCSDVEFVEQFNQHLFIKRKDQNCTVLDGHNCTQITLPNTDTCTPGSFLFLYDQHSFLLFEVDGNVSVWNCKGQQLRKLKDHRFFRPDMGISNVCITNRHDALISVCQSEDSSGKRMVQMHTSCVASGECITKLNSSMLDCDLKTVSCLFYDDTQQQLFVGTETGDVIAVGN